VLEGRAAVEQLQLFSDPVFRGNDVPRGDGEPVLLIPGFLAGDWSLTTLAAWLRRLGYRPFGSGLRVNQYGSEATVALLARSLRAARAACSEPVTVIGHSRGGVLAVVLAHREPQLVRRVITLGSPLADPLAVSPLTLMAVRAIRRGHGLTASGPLTEHPRFVQDLAAHPRVPTTSVYSRSDAIVDWHACVRPDVQSVEVPGSHVGLAANRAVYRVVAGLLPRGATSAVSNARNARTS
jgi:pimeloyl-ACP methyl ester carboxylesterase